MCNIYACNIVVTYICNIYVQHICSIYAEHTCNIYATQHNPYNLFATSTCNIYMCSHLYMQHIYNLYMCWSYFFAYIICKKYVQHVSNTYISNIYVAYRGGRYFTGTCAATCETVRVLMVRVRTVRVRTGNRSNQLKGCTVFDRSAK